MDFSYIITCMGLLFSLSSAQVLFSITAPLRGDEGDTLTIVCGLVINGTTENPSPIVIRRNGVVFTDERLSSNLNSTHKIYTLNELNRDDHQSRVLCAYAERVSSSIEITVYYPPEITGPVDGELTVAEMGSSNFTFSISANPTAEINVEPMRDVVVVMNNTVKFVNVMRADEGLYSIRISNRLGNVSVNLTLIVEYEPSSTATTSSVSSDGPSSTATTSSDGSSSTAMTSLEGPSSTATTSSVSPVSLSHLLTVLLPLSLYEL